MIQTENHLLLNGYDSAPRYTIIDREDGLMISDSRSSVFDVMELYEQGESIEEIAATFNLVPQQVQTAIDYIEENRETMEPQLVEALRLRQEREEYHRAIEEELWKKIAKLPMTPKRAAFYALREKNRRLDEEERNAVYTQ